ncbi:MAG: hypothetical protein ACR2HW_05755 [Gemmatimonadales bacterium]
MPLVSKLRFKIAMSLDGYSAGPEQSVKNPLGIGGERLHEWAFPLAAWLPSPALGSSRSFRRPLWQLGGNGIAGWATP